MKIGNNAARLCQQREIEKRQAQHRKKIRNMRPTSKSNAKAALDTTEPRSALHLKMNLKKQQLQGEHFSQIEQENQLLMKKIYHIMNDEIGEKATEVIEHAPSLTPSPPTNTKIVRSLCPSSCPESE